MADPIVIWGAGAIGGTLGAWWARAGHDVLLVDGDADHVEACRTAGLEIVGPIDSFRQQIAAVLPSEVDGVFRRIILAVKSHHTEEAAAALEPHLAHDGLVLSAQNGLNELAIARQVGEHRTMGAFVNFGAHWLGPGQISLGSRGAVVVGEVYGPPQTRTHEMLDLLRIFEPSAIASENIWGYLWSKLAYGAMLVATATNMDSMADNFDNPDRFPVWRALGREVLSVAEAHEVTPAAFDCFDPLSFIEGASEGEVWKAVSKLADFNRNPDKTHSGVWRDLAIRKRPTEVAAQLGIVSHFGQAVGVETPVVSRLVALIRDIEAGRRGQSADTFGELLKLCR